MSTRCAALAVLIAVLLVAACGGPRATPTTAPTAAPTVAPTAGPTVASPTAPGPQRIAVTLTEMLIEPQHMTVPLGVPVTFVITNNGVIEHEFYLGDEAAQAEHEEEMSSGEPMHGHANGVTVQAGETEEMTITFTSGEWLAGCHVPGHYPAGMKATITAE